jgi:[ribosomal protein S18]-alanine N-acetyltransferase
MNLLFSPFEPEYAPEIATWFADAAEARSWGGRDVVFPVDPQAFLAWRGDPDIQPFIAHHGRELVGYGEIWRDEPAKEVELARIVVRPSHRRAGVGRALVAGLVQRARGCGTADIFVRVAPENAAALRCYEASGFHRLPADVAQEYNRGQPCVYVWMQERLGKIV